MRMALCTQDGETYQASDFIQVADFIAKKRFLECPECQGPAFYRGPTRNGREACFGARPHADGCTLATPEHDGGTRGQGDGEDEVFTTGQRILLDFNYGALVTTQEGEPAGTTTVTADVGMLGGTGTGMRETMNRRMSSILRSLMESEEFRRSTQMIEVTGHGEFTVADLFVGFSEVTDDHIGSYHGFWGMVPDARRDGKGTLWLNSGGREDISILSGYGLIAETYKRFHIDDEEDIAGAYILVLGELRIGPSGKRYVQVKDQMSLTLRLAR